MRRRISFIKENRNETILEQSKIVFEVKGRYGIVRLTLGSGLQLAEDRNNLTVKTVTALNPKLEILQKGEHATPTVFINDVEYTPVKDYLQTDVISLLHTLVANGDAVLHNRLALIYMEHFHNTNWKRAIHTVLNIG